MDREENFVLISMRKKVARYLKKLRTPWAGPRKQVSRWLKKAAMSLSPSSHREKPWANCDFPRKKSENLFGSRVAKKIL